MSLDLIDGKDERTLFAGSEVWGDFVNWAKSVGGPVWRLVNESYCGDPKELARQLRKRRARNPDVDEVRLNIIEACKTAHDFVAISDGTGEPDDDD